MKQMDKMPGSAEEFGQSPWVARAGDEREMGAGLQKAGKIIDRLGGQSKVGRKLREAVDLYTGNAKGQGLLTGRNLLLLGGAILYFVCPVDILPDVLPVIGWLDDIGILALVLRAILPAGEKGEGEESAPEVEAKVVEQIAEGLPRDAKFRGDLEAIRRDLDQTDEGVVDELEKKLADPLRRIVVTGTFSAGKSSLINCILDEELLPVSPLPCTPVLTTIMYGTARRMTVLYQDDSVQVLDDLTILRDTKAPVLQGAREILVTLPHEFLKNGLSIVDTCGLDYSQFDERSFEQLPHSSAFVFVKDIDIPNMSREEDDFLSGATGKITGDQVIAVFNKADLVDDEKVAFSDIRERTRAYFDKKQLRGVCVYMTSAVSPRLYETEDFKRELRRRAALSIPTAAARDAENAIVEANRTLVARKEARRELEVLEAEEKRRARELLVRKREREIEAVEELADKAKDRFAAHLCSFIDERLMPELATLIKNTDMNERFTATIMETARNGLAYFIKAEVQQIARYFEQNIPSVRVDADTLATMPSPDWKPVNEETFKKIGSMLLPGATLTCLLLMGPLGWLTGVALPLFVMDRFKFGEKLVGIIGELGPTRRAREEFRQRLAEGLRDAHARICDSINRDVIDDMVARFKKLSLRETL